MNIKWLAVLLIFSGSVSNSFATLIVDDPSQGVVRDDRGTPGRSDDMYWGRDFSRFTNRTYGEQLDSIAALNISSSLASKSWGNFRMASMDDVRGLFTNPMGDWFYNIFQPSYEQVSTGLDYTYHNVFYFARINDWSEVWGQSDMHSVSARNYDYLEYSDGHQQHLDQWSNGLDSEFDNHGDDVADPWLGAWVVADHLDSVPEPSSLLLFSAGILGVAGIVLRKKNKGSQV